MTILLFCVLFAAFGAAALWAIVRERWLECSLWIVCLIATGVIAGNTMDPHGAGTPRHIEDNAA